MGLQLAARFLKSAQNKEECSMWWFTCTHGEQAAVFLAVHVAVCRLAWRRSVPGIAGAAMLQLAQAAQAARDPQGGVWRGSVTHLSLDAAACSALCNVAAACSELQRIAMALKSLP